VAKAKGITGSGEGLIAQAQRPKRGLDRFTEPPGSGRHTETEQGPRGGEGEGDSRGQKNWGGETAKKIKRYQEVMEGKNHGVPDLNKERHARGNQRRGGKPSQVTRGKHN